MGGKPIMLLLFAVADRLGGGGEVVCFGCFCWVGCDSVADDDAAAAAAAAVADDDGDDDVRASTPAVLSMLLMGGPPSVNRESQRERSVINAPECDGCEV